MALDDLRTDIEADTLQKDPTYRHWVQHNSANEAILDHEDRIVDIEQNGGGGFLLPAGVSITGNRTLVLDDASTFFEVEQSNEEGHVLTIPSGVFQPGTWMEFRCTSASPVFFDFEDAGPQFVGGVVSITAADGVSRLLYLGDVDGGDTWIITSYDAIPDFDITSQGGGDSGPATESSRSANINADGVHAEAGVVHESFHTDTTPGSDQNIVGSVTVYSRADVDPPDDAQAGAYGRVSVTASILDGDLATPATTEVSSGLVAHVNTDLTFDNFLVLVSPNGSSWRVRVANDGSLSATPGGI